MSKNELRQAAIDLREKGKSYSEINRIINVSKASLSLWLKNVQLSDRQIEILNKRKLDTARGKAATVLRERRISKSLVTIREAWAETPSLIHDPIFLLGMSLYWAEGGKTLECISFSNSDPLMIKLIVKWLKEFCKIPKLKIKAQLHIHSLHSRDHAEKYWSKISGIPISQFTKTYIKSTSLGQRKNKLYSGTFVVRVYDATLFRKFIGWKLGVLEYLDIIKLDGARKDRYLKDIVTNKKYKLV